MPKFVAAMEKLASLNEDVFYHRFVSAFAHSYECILVLMNGNSVRFMC